MEEIREYVQDAETWETVLDAVDSPLTFRERLLLSLIIFMMSPFFIVLGIIMGFLVTMLLSLAILAVPFFILATDVFVEVADNKKIKS